MIEDTYSKDINLRKCKQHLYGDTVQNSATPVLQILCRLSEIYRVIKISGWIKCRLATRELKKRNRKFNPWNLSFQTRNILKAAIHLFLKSWSGGQSICWQIRRTGFLSDLSNVQRFSQGHRHRSAPTRFEFIILKVPRGTTEPND